MTKYRITLILLVLLVTAASLFALQVLLTLENPLTATPSFVSLAAVGALLIAHLRHWRWSIDATIVTITLLVIVTTEPNMMRDQVSLSIYIPAILAATLRSPRASLVVFGLVLLGVALMLGLRTGAVSPETLGPTYSITNLIFGCMIALGIALVSAVTRYAQAEAETHAHRAEEALKLARQRAEELEQQAEVAHTLRMEAENAQQELATQLSTIEAQRAVIQEMTVPILPVSEKALVMPLVGSLYGERLRLIEQRALQALEQSRARYLILDITGVPVVDTEVAKVLVQVVRAARLLGSEVILVGIRPEVAQAIVGLGLTLEGMVTYSNLQSGLQYAL